MHNILSAAHSLTAIGWKGLFYESPFNLPVWHERSYSYLKYFHLAVICAYMFCWGNPADRCLFSDCTLLAKAMVKNLRLQHSCVVVVAVIVAFWLRVDGSVAVAFNVEGGMPTCVMALGESLAMPMSSMRASRRGY